MGKKKIVQKYSNIFEKKKSSGILYHICTRITCVSVHVSALLLQGLGTKSERVLPLLHASGLNRITQNHKNTISSTLQLRSIMFKRLNS